MSDIANDSVSAKSVVTMKIITKTSNKYNKYKHRL